MNNALYNCVLRYDDNSKNFFNVIPNHIYGSSNVDTGLFFVKKCPLTPYSIRQIRSQLSKEREQEDPE